MVDFYQARFGEASISIKTLKPTSGAGASKRNVHTYLRRSRLSVQPLGGFFQTMLIGSPQINKVLRRYLRPVLLENEFHVIEPRKGWGWHPPCIWNCRTLNWAEFPSTGGEFQAYRSFQTHELDVLLRLSGQEARIKQNEFALWNVVAIWKVESRYNVAGTVQQADAAAMIQAAEEILAIL